MNLAEILETPDPGRTALMSRSGATTYGDLREQVARLRGGLRDLGVAPGDRVAIVALNTGFFPLAYFAVLGAGAVAVPLNPGSPRAELQREIQAVGARVILAGPTGRDALADLEPAGLGVEHVVVAGDAPGTIPVDRLLGAEPAPLVQRADDDVAVLVFTAGTGGSPKAAMLTHGNLRSNLEQVQSHPGRAVQPDDVSFGVLPMFHIFGLNVILGLSVYAGASVVLVERFDPASALELIRDSGVTIVAGAPPMFSAWAQMAPDPDAFASVRLAVSGAAPLPPEVATAFEARFGLPIHEGYGLTEAAPTVTSSVVGGQVKPGSIGVPLPGVEVRLVDEEGEDALVGDAGEIWVRGPNVFAGYWEDEKATASALTPDGWLRTGDIAVADDDGYLWIVDRAKDLIIVSGFNVYPAEVEEALLDMPGIADVAIAGVPHPYSGETVKAWVVAEDGARLDEDRVIEFCAGRLARYKCPTTVTFVDELPHGLGGKLLRRALR